ncbi:hypothetical protein BDK63_001202 [Halomonas campaniensis]|jgi:uncharacterized protein|uniref:C4-dicarboxylate ABC transporter n=1 Tax=Halomonas campaniensis TaxID=213554 RepID=A0A7W5K1Q4_9GAMM|nr:TAXI family TRAP transporter solute-binding subunit [Halomonas campaniensis]MBB3330345.1 hypothetical protein [Halomonas campaniensis]
MTTTTRRLLGLLFGTLLSMQAMADHYAILTGGTSGVYYPVGLALKSVLDRELPEHTFSVVSTQASVENLNLLQKGEGIIALAQGDILSDAWEGNPEAGFPSSRTRIRLIGAAYPNFIHLLARSDAGITSLEDLAGKRVSVGAARSGNELNARALLGAAGLSYADLTLVEYLHYGESVELLVRGELDVVIVSAGLGVAAVTEASRRARVDLVPIAPEFIERRASMFMPGVIPAGSYPGQAEAVPTAALNNFLVTTSEAPDALVYRITRAIFDNLESIYAAHPAAEVISREGAVATLPIDLHPGAARYFRQAGVMP